MTILPADTFTVLCKSILEEQDRQILTTLYLPIIGSIPVMLYFSLWADLDNAKIMSCEYTHHHLITNMHLSLQEIIEARFKLEAIGLVKVFVKEDSVNNYIYELYSPISAYEFFHHPILNIVLYNNVGKKEYNKLANYYKIPKINLHGFKEITKSFNDVFSSIPLTSYEVINDDIKKRQRLKLKIDSNFDFDFLIASIGKDINVTKDIKELIINLSFIYELDALKMSSIIQGCVNERGNIIKDDLRKRARNYYQFDNNGVLPSVVTNIQPEFLKKPVGDTSKRAKMIYTFENISPYNFMKSKMNGGEPINRDLKLIEDLIIDYELNPGVVNVLVDYVLKTNSNKLTRNLVETIAGQWKRNKIDTVEEAMACAEKEHKKYNKNKTTIRRKSTTNVEIPDWFDKKIDINNATEQDKNEMEELLKEFK
ncbi:MAG: DnaD domain protein [bacterium]|nr:DnaD domain protein [bacterium]